MAGLKLQRFGGMLPAWDDRLLPDGQCAYSRNGYLFSGAIAGWREPKILRNLTNSAATFAYRIPIKAASYAFASLVFISNPNEGDLVTVGNQAYKFTVAVTNANDVLIGISAQASSQNLFIALTEGATDGILCGIGTTPNGAITLNSPYLGSPFSSTTATDAPGSNKLFLTQIAPGTININSVSCVPAATNGSAKFTAVIYSSTVDQNNNPVPGSLISAGNEVVGCISGTTLTSTFGLPITLIEGLLYWIGFITDTSVALHRITTGANNVSASTSYGLGPPSVAPIVSFLQPNWQLWGNTSLTGSTDVENMIGTNAFTLGTFPYITLYAPSTGAAFNTTIVGENTTGVRLTWLWGALGLFLTQITSTFRGGVNQTLDTDITLPSYWLEFVDPDTNVVRSPLADDSFGRYYFASPSEPPQYNTYDRIANGDSPWLLGIPAPGCAPGVTTTGGGNATTVGNDTIFSDSTNSVDSPGSNIALFIPFTPSGAMTLSDVTIGMQSTDPSCSFNGVLYEDVNGVPGNFLALGGTTVGCTAGGSVTSTFTIPLGLSANITYWLGMIISRSETIQVADQNTNGIKINATIIDGIPVLGGGFIAFQPDWFLFGDVTTSVQLEARAYVYTWISAYGEEGPPSPPTIETGWNNATWNIDLFTPAPDDMGGHRNITRKRLYRSITGTGNVTSYFYVADLDVNSSTFADNVSDALVATNTVLPSTFWFPPPEGLQGLVSMPNGMIAGFQDNEVWFCESYRPHAWPSNYVVTTEYPIVGLGVSGQNLIACTTVKPTIFTGATPATVNAVVVDMPEPCISRGSIVNTDSGVYYASHNGLIFITTSFSGSNVTEQWITRERWNNFTPYKNIKAMKMAACYFAFGAVVNGDNSVAQQGFVIPIVPDTENFTIFPQPGGHRVGFSQLSSPFGTDIENVLVDPWTGIGMIISNNSLYYYDFTDPAPTITPYLYRTKIFQQTAKHNFEAIRIWFNVPAGSPDIPLTRTQTAANFTTTPQLILGPTMHGIVRVLADSNNDGIMEYVTERELRSSGELLRIASGFKSEFWQFEVEARVTVTVGEAATSVKELGKI